MAYIRITNKDLITHLYIFIQENFIKEIKHSQEENR